MLGVGWQCGADDDDDDYYYYYYYYYNTCVCVVVMWLQVQLYFMILERLGKCEEALDVIRGPLGGRRARVCVCVCVCVCLYLCQPVCVFTCIIMGALAESLTMPRCVSVSPP